jgi:hypothetical protein
MPNLTKIFLKFPLTVGVATPSQKFEKIFVHLQHLSRSRYGSNGGF